MYTVVISITLSLITSLENHLYSYFVSLHYKRNVIYFLGWKAFGVRWSDQRTARWTCWEIAPTVRASKAKRTTKTPAAAPRWGYATVTWQTTGTSWRPTTSAAPTPAPYASKPTPRTTTVPDRTRRAFCTRLGLYIYIYTRTWLFTGLIEFQCYDVAKMIFLKLWDFFNCSEQPIWIKFTCKKMAL